MSRVPPRGAPALSLVRGAASDPAADDLSLVARLRAGDPNAPAALFDRYQSLVNTILLRILGADRDHDDRVQEAFLEALRSLPSLRDDSAFRAWMTTITVRVARAELRRRRVRRIFLLTRDEELPDHATDDDPVARQTVRALGRVLDAMPTEERIAFALRFIHGEELTDVAAAVGCSLATIKRRLGRAEERFVALCRRDPSLAARIDRGRWSSAP